MYKNKRNIKLLVLAAALIAAVFVPANGGVAAACAQPSTDYGSATMSLTVATAGTYRVWSRIESAVSTNNTYLLEVDGTSCYTVGGTALAANTWTWVNYQNGNASSTIDAALTAGTHSIKAIGNSPGVKLDSVLFVTDTTCVPTGDGSNCMVAADVTPPTVSLTAPTDGSTVSGNVSAAATASDASGIAKVEFYVDNGLAATVTTSPYNFTWSTSGLQNGTHTLAAKAYDKAGNSNSTSVSVTVQNGDTQAPTTPSGLTAKASAYNKVDLSWTASTDNVGVAGYWVLRDGSPLVKVNNTTSYTDSTVAANTKYSYQVEALDAAGNTSGASTAASVTTPTVPDTQPPSAPANLTATAASANQINLSWSASTDNVGVTAYDVYRSTGTDSPSKIATVTTTTFGDGSLNSSTKYTYYVIARDAAGNSSGQSGMASATTQATAPQPTGRGVLRGTIKDANGKRLFLARAVLWVKGVKHIYFANRDGTYVAAQLPVNTYQVIYRAFAHNEQTSTVVISDGMQTINNVTLTARR